MQRINRAYAVLSVPYRRRNYDLERFKTAQPLPEAATVSPRDVARHGRQSAPAWSASSRVRAVRWWPGAVGAVTVCGRMAAVVRRRPVWLAAAAAAGGLLLACTVAVVVRGGAGARPAATAVAARPGVRVVAATTPIATATGAAAAASPVPTAPAAMRADHLLLAIAERFPPVNGLTDAGRRPPGADRGWAFSADGCSVFAGEYDAPESADNARRYWSQQNGRYAYEGSGSLVAAVGDCDTQQHQFELLNAIADVFARPR